MNEILKNQLTVLLQDDQYWLVKMEEPLIILNEEGLLIDTTPYEMAIVDENIGVWTGSIRVIPRQKELFLESRCLGSIECILN